MRKKMIVTSMAVMLSASLLFGCSQEKEKTEGTTTAAAIQSTSKTNGQDTTESSDSSADTVSVSETIAEGYDEEDDTRVLVAENGTKAEDGVTVLESTAENTIYLKRDSAETKAKDVTVKGSTATITAPGVYILTGTLDDGQIVVDCADKGTVELVLYNADISNSTNSPIYIKDSKKTLLVLAENSKNILSDAASYAYEDTEKEEPSACLFSKEDLVISGGGALTVTANFNNGIASKDTLKITGGTISVTAPNNTMKGKDCLMIAGGSFELDAGGDGLKAENSDDTSLGYLDISGGTFKITSDGDGIQASSSVKITGGTFGITTGSGAGTVKSTANQNFQSGWDRDNNSTDAEDTASVKAVKAETALTIAGGTFTIDSEDDALHSNGTFDMTGGTLTAATGDDGIHAEDTLTIGGGEIRITQCYEGIESPEIVINGGTAYVTASDDGVNAAGGTASTMGKKPGMMSSSTGTLVINDGYLYIDSSGDGLDANGNMTVNGGTVLVEGPTNDGNAAIDYDGTLDLNGGYLLASGSAGMMEGVNGSSSQNSVMVYFDSTVSAGTTFAVNDSSGNLVMAFTPTKTSSCFLFTSPELVTGETYTISTGGTCSGTAKDGLYTEGNYSGGTEADSFTVSSTVTTVGSGKMGGNMGGGPGGNPAGKNWK